MSLISPEVQKRRVRHSSFLDSSLRLDGILDILECVKSEPLYFTQLRMKSRIMYKQSFLNYLKYCKRCGFVESYPVSMRRIVGRGLRKREAYIFYKLTDKGKLWMEMTSTSAK